MTTEERRKALEALLGDEGIVFKSSDGKYYNSYREDTDLTEKVETIRSYISAPVQCVPEEVIELIKQISWMGSWYDGSDEANVGYIYARKYAVAKAEKALALLNSAATGGEQK